MILDAIFAVVLGVIQLVVSLFTTLVPAVPGWFVTALGQIDGLMGYVWALDAWLPVGLLLTIAAAVAGGWAVAVVIGGIRWVVSYFLGGGGTT